MEGNLKWLVVWCALLFIGVYASEKLDTISETDKAVCDEWTHSCANGGKCIGKGSERFCKCRRGTSGDFCQTVDDCERDICGKGTGQDVFCMYDQTRDSAVCICGQKDLAFDRVEGQCRFKCHKDKDCANGASCLRQGIGDKENVTVDLYDLTYCRCLPDTNGTKCENVLSCSKEKEFCGTDPKVNCYFDVTDKTAKCACPDKKTVFDYVSKSCKDCDCGKEALNCSYEDGAKRCICGKGFYETGGTCTDCDCGENGLDCMLENGNKRCICKGGFFDVEGKCIECACGPQAKGCSFKDGKKTCDCKEGFKQNGDVCESCSCRRNYKDCDFIDGAMTCTCDDGYVQVDDICQESCSDDKPCENGGSCENGVCKCKKGTGGVFCQIVTKCEYNDPCPKVWGIACAYDPVKEQDFCKCTTSGEVYVQGEGRCKKTCDENTCKNGATCEDETEGRFCKCKKGTSGDWCETIDQCRTWVQTKSFCGTITDITCKYDADKEEPYCECTKENEVYVDKSSGCKKTCDVETRPCEHWGTCTEKDGTYFCECKSGTSGDLCEIIDQCAVGRIEKLCGTSKHVKCGYKETEEEAYCYCDHDDFKFNTETKKCTITCDESENKCKRGDCKTTDDGDFCQCPDGFSGDLCNIVNACEGENPLCGKEENAACVYDDTKGKPVCNCLNGETAFDYNLKACREECSNDTKQCHHGNPCLESGENNFCNCKDTLSGDLCKEIKACQRKGVCGDGKDVDCVYDENTESNAFCQCHDKNKKFDPKLNTCRRTCKNEDSCKHGSSCVTEPSSNNSFCRCGKGLSGDFCETLDDCEKTCGDRKDVNCVFDEENKKINCSCTDGTKRFDKVGRQCRVPCEWNDCKSDSICRRYSNDPNRDDSDIGPDDATFCRCWEGSRGDFCEIIDDCENGKVNCSAEDGAICVYGRYLRSGYCDCVDEKKEFDTVAEKCYECDCGPLSFGCSFLKGEKYCNCKDSAYQRDAYCFDCACGENFKRCHYDRNLREKKCECNPGFSQNNGVCEPCDCGPDSKSCYFRKGELTCDCKEGFVAKDEYCQPACNATNPCKYGGECLDGLCRCKKGTAGTFCQIVVDCSNNEICGRQEDVLCLYDEWRREAYCACNGTGLIFDDDKKECVECDCAEKGVCSLKKRQKQCTCIPTYGSIKGKCTECQCGDKSTSCSFKDGKFRCECERGFADNNRTCTECNCGENGDCSYINNIKTCNCYGDYGEKNGTCVPCGCGDLSEGCTFDDEETTCKCKKGSLQFKEKCQACDCGKDGICSFDKAGKKECDCDSGYAEKNGKCVEECNNNCRNGGKCEEMGDNNFCNCSRGTSGDRCEIIDDCSTVYKDCTEDLGTCSYNETSRSAYCECDHGAFYDDDLKRCRIACSDDVPCENGGSCDRSVCQCSEGTSGDLCATVDGCAEIEEKCHRGIAECKYAPDKPGKAECVCPDEDFMFSEEQKGCRAIWCLENACAANARCYYEVTTKTAYCQCNNKSLYYNNTGKSCDAVDACLLAEDCDKFEVCDNGKCVCPTGHEVTEEGCRPKLCATNICGKFYSSECRETDLLGTVHCFCGDGRFYDGSSQCRNGDCFLPDRWPSCYNGCPDGMEKTETGCKAKDENKTCEKDCGEYGFCMIEGTKEECKCLPGFAKMASGSCILDASVVCASKMLSSNSSRCECSGILKYAENGITCEKKTCSDKDVQEECAAMNAAECKDNWYKPGLEPGSRYECLCGPGYSKNANNICTEKCKLESHASECASRGQMCLLDDVHNANCKCPPTTEWNDATQRCDTLNENTYMIQNVPVIKKKYMKKDDSVDKVKLNADIVKAMKGAYQSKILEYAYLFNYEESENVLNCSVLLQFKQPTKWDIQRYRFSRALKLSCKNCSVFLLPPVVLDKELYKEMFLEQLSFCSDPLRNTLCGEGSVCKDRRCSCGKGYRTIDSSVHTTRDFTTLRCEDVNECLEETDSCSVNTTCVNSPGDYYCECKQGFKKLSDTIPYKNAHDKEKCVDFCTPNPCAKGSCNVKEKGFDCSCVIGYSGSLCDRADKTLIKSNDKSKIIGGVLGALLGVSLLAFLIYFLKKRSQSNSEADFIPSSKPIDAEMAERRAHRGVSNRAYE